MIKQVTMKNNRGTVITTKFNELGDELEYINSDGARHKNEYDSENRIIRRINTHGEYTAIYDYEYNEEGMLAKTNFNGVITEYIYDDKGRTTGIIMDDGQVYKFNHNDRDDVIFETCTKNGEVEYTTTHEYDYENLTQVTKCNSRIMGSSTKTIKYRKTIGEDETYYKDSFGSEYWKEYNERGLITRYIDISDFEKIYTYDDNGNLISMKDSLGFEKSCEYDDKGRIIKYEISTGVKITKEYNDRGDVIKKENLTTGVIEEFEYIYY